MDDSFTCHRLPACYQNFDDEIVLNKMIDDCVFFCLHPGLLISKRTMSVSFIFMLMALFQTIANLIAIKTCQWVFIRYNRYYLREKLGRVKLYQKLGILKKLSNDKISYYRGI